MGSIIFAYITLEQWSFGATIILLVVNTLFFAALVWQIIENRKAIHASATAARAANLSVKEARRARIDEQAPRVSLFFETPLILSTDNGPQIDFVPTNQLFNTLTDKNTVLSYVVDGTVLNEGRSTAVIELGNTAVFVDNDENEIGKSCRLKPNAEAKLQWTYGAPIHEWIKNTQWSDYVNEGAYGTLEIISKDQFENGVVDHIYATLYGRPLEGKNGSKENFVFANDVATTVHPTLRTYRGEKSTIVLPWESYLEQYGLHNRDDKASS